MALTVKHTFASAVADGADNTLVRPSNWNDAHTITGTIDPPLTGNGATVTVSTPLIDVSQTWNAAGVAFTALKLNITNTASAAGSLLADLQFGSVSQFNVDKTGIVTTGAVSVASGSLFGHGNTLIGIDAGRSIYTAGGAYLNIDSRLVVGALALHDNTGYIAFQSASSPTEGGVDLKVYRDAAAQTLAIANGTNASAFRVYNTTDNTATGTAPTNYERGVFDWTTTANVLTIGTQSGGTGAARHIQIVGAGNALMGDATVFGVGGFVSFGNGIVISGGGTSTIANGAPSLAVGSGDPVVSIGDPQNSAIHGGWIQWGGQARVTSDFSITSTTLTNVTGLSATLRTGRTYWFETELYVTDAGAGGVQAAISGTATATAIQYTGYTIADNAIKGKTNATALGTAVGSTTTTETVGIIVRITGIITVSNPGTLTVQIAQNTSNATATIAKRGSYLLVHDMP